MATDGGSPPGPPRFQDRLEGWLAGGWRALAPALRAEVLEGIRPFSGPDGGFRGRQGGSDIYYTDFAVRLLDLAGAPASEFGGAAGYLEALPPPEDLVHLFCRHNVARILRRRGLAARGPTGDRRVFAAHRVEGGGFGQPGRREPSAYLTFLAALIREMTGKSLPDPKSEAAALRALRAPGGGFRDGPGDASPQASTTAAGSAALELLGGADAREVAEDARFLAGLQTPEGGIRAHPAAARADLLSTFTALTALAAMRGLNRLRLAPLGRYVLSLRTKGGGFRSSPEDPESDPEYAYYGVGSLCLLQAHLDGLIPS